MSGEELVEGVDYTIEGGLYVFTRHYLLKRGYCCDQGCRNCPYREPQTVERPQPRAASDGRSCEKA